MRGIGRERKDDPGTWETLVSPRETPARRGAGDLSPHTLSVGGRTLGVAEPRGFAKKKRSPRGRPKARGTGAEADGDEGVGGLHRSDEVGKRVAPEAG